MTVALTYIGPVKNSTKYQLDPCIKNIFSEPTNSQVIRVRTTFFESNAEELKKRPPYFPSAVPSDLAPYLAKFHGESKKLYDQLLVKKLT
jgi:hypothetical protein